MDHLNLKNSLLSSMLLCLLALSFSFSEALAQNCRTFIFNGTPPVAPTATTMGVGGTGTIQTYTVPAGVTLIRLDARGAKGGTSPTDSGGQWQGGKGGRVQGTYAVTPGDVLYIIVGGKGGDGSPDAGPNQERTASGGGGATVVSNGPIGSGTLLLVAGGGGGAGHSGVGGPANSSSNNDGGIGAGGASFSADGGISIYGDDCGKGGIALNAGANGGANTCFKPQTNCGGYGGGGAGNFSYAHNGAGGGGGGGYVGGHGGGIAGGGGGSSYSDPNASNVIINLSADDDGSVVITALGFTMPANGGSTVTCPTAANVIPAHPTGILDKCGNEVAIAGPVVSTTPTCEGTKTYTWTYSSQGVSQDWVYTYTIERNDFNGPPNSGAVRVCLAQTEQPIPPVISDACGNTITPTGPVVVDSPTSLTCEGTRTYTYTYTDCAGHSHDWSFVWTLDVPTLSVDAPGTATVSCPSAPPPTYPNTITDACGRPLTVTGPTVTSSPDPITCEGTRTYTWNLTDCAGNTNTWSWIITIERNDFTLPANGGSTVACPSAANVVPTPPSKMSECGEPIIPTGPMVTATPACEGTKTYTWTYTDCEGNSHDWSYIYTIERNDFTVPANGSATVSCPSDITVPTPPTVTSHCGETLTPTGPVIVNTPDPLVCAGTRTYTWTYTDCEGNTHPWSFTYTVSPTLPVTITCPMATTTAACQTQAAVNAAFSTWLATASGSGGCGSTITNNNTGAPSACGGSTTVTFTNNNGCGNQTCQATFTVAAPPTVVLTCPTNQTEAFGQTQAAINAKFAAWLATASGTGGCGGSFTNNATVAPPATGGSVTVTFTKTSNCTPLTSTCQASFTVSSIPPVMLTCPTNATASSICLTQAQLTAEYNAWLATASGSGGCNGELTHDGATPPSICSATATVKMVTFTYTSTCEPFITTCQRTFTVPAYPDFNGPPNSGATRVCLAQTEQPIPPQVSDACGKPIIPTGPVVVDSPSSLTCEGTRTYIFTYTDCAGHSHDWSFVWTLDVPTLSVDNPGTATVPCPSFTPPTYPNTITDACGRPVTVTGPTVTSSPDPITCEGTRTYTWNLTDCAGNTNTWSWVITIERNDFTLPANGGSTVACPAAANVVPTPPSKMSECGEPIIPTGPVVSATPACEGTKTYTWTYTDCEGNSHDWSYIYTIERNDFTMPANGGSTVACPAAANVAPTPPVVTSHCGEPITPTGPVVTATPACEGTKTYTWTYTDCEGNSHDWSFIYTIERVPFTVPANGSATVNAPSLAIQPTPPVVLSNCGETLTPAAPVITNTPIPIVCTGTRTYTWTYTDCEGNTVVWSFVYTIIDNTPPMATCSNSTVTFNGQESIVLNANTLVSATDNCGIQSITLSPSVITCLQVGQQVPVTATVTDINGNTATCTGTVTVGGLPCGWSQNPNGVNCTNGNSVTFNAATGVYTATSTNCFYGPPFTGDATAFAQRTLCGNGSITALVTGINPLAGGWAGIVMRENNTAGAKKAQLMTNLGSDHRREFRTTTNGAAQPQQFPSVGRYWLRITRVGNQFTMFVSSNGVNWFPAGAQNIVMGNCIQMGLVATNYTANSTVTATFSNVSFTGSNSGLGSPLSPDVFTSLHSPLTPEFDVFPNPTSGQLNIDLTQYAGKPVRIEMYSLEGKLLKFTEMDEVQTTVETLDLSQFQRGMYLVRVKSEGLPDATRKVVLNR